MEVLWYERLGYVMIDLKILIQTYFHRRITKSSCDLDDLKIFLPGQIARALAIFNVDEVVIFNDNPGVKVRGKAFEGVTKKTNANIVLARILQYLETPQ